MGEFDEGGGGSPRGNSPTTVRNYGIIANVEQIQYYRFILFSATTLIILSKQQLCDYQNQIFYYPIITH